jgi:hypothetical protein
MGFLMKTGVQPIVRGRRPGPEERAPFGGRLDAAVATAVPAQPDGETGGRP